MHFFNSFRMLADSLIGKSDTLKPQVAFTGRGPARLLLSQILHLAGIDNEVPELARAGVHRSFSEHYVGLLL